MFTIIPSKVKLKNKISFLALINIRIGEADLSFERIPILFFQNAVMADTAVLIYDEECSLCCGCMRWLKLHAIGSGVFEIIPCQSKKRMSLFPGLNENACLEELHMVLPDGQIIAGDKTLPEILIRLKYFRWLAFLFRIPVIRLFPYAVYRLIANNRYIISKTILPLTEEEI